MNNGSGLASLIHARCDAALGAHKSSPNDPLCKKTPKSENEREACKKTNTQCLLLQSWCDFFARTLKRAKSLKRAGAKKGVIFIPSADLCQYLVSRQLSVKCNIVIP